MTTINIPDKALLEDWLDRSGTEYYLCGRCEGLHIRTLQEVPGVIDSRLFLEDYGLLFSTELEIRPGAMLLVSADLGRLNMDYPILKIFLDVVDDALPQLVLAATCPAGAGMSESQFNLFMSTALEATAHLAEACGEFSYLYLDPEPAKSQLH